MRLLFGRNILSKQTNTKARLEEYEEEILFVCEVSDVLYGKCGSPGRVEELRRSSTSVNLASGKISSLKRYQQ